MSDVDQFEREWRSTTGKTVIQVFPNGIPNKRGDRYRPESRPVAAKPKATLQNYV